MYKHAGGRTSKATKAFESQRNMAVTTPRMAKLPKKANGKIDQSADAAFKAAAKKNLEGNPGLAAKIRGRKLAAARAAQRQKIEAHKMRAEKKAKKRSAKLAKQQRARTSRTAWGGAAIKR